MLAADILQAVPEPVQTGGAVAVVLVMARLVEAGIRWRHGELKAQTQLLAAVRELNVNVQTLLRRVETGFERLERGG